MYMISDMILYCLVLLENKNNIEAVVVKSSHSAEVQV